MQHFLKVDNTSSRHCREHVLGTTQVSFLPKFKASSKNFGQKRHLLQCFEDMGSAIDCKENTDNKLKQLLKII